MAERAKGVKDWIRGLVGKRETPAATEVAHPLLGARALEACELLVSDAVCRVAGSFRSDEPTNGARNAFDRTVVLQDSQTAQAALATATGLALSGLRTTVFLQADQLAECALQLRAAVAQHLPLVVQATVGTRSANGIDAAARSGAFIYAARDAQEACDLTLAAHRTAEHSLTPGLVLLDRAESAWTIARVALPDVERLRELVGEADAQIDCPTRAQSLLFGDRRRRLPRWFDLDHSLSVGVEHTEADRGAAGTAAHLLFASDVATISAEALEAVSSATRRPLTPIRAHGLDEARRVVVTCGSVASTAEAVTDRLGREGGSRGGVLGLTLLCPFPGDEVRQALSRAEVITVLERRESPSAATLLQDRVRASVMGRGARLLSASYQRTNAADLAAVYRNMNAGPAARESVQLGLAPLADAPNHPRRQALVQRTRRECPDLDQATLDGTTERLDLTASDARTVLLCIGHPVFPYQALESLAEALHDALGAQTVGRSNEIEPGLWQLWLTASADSPGVPVTETAADVALLADPRFPLRFSALADAAAIVVASDAAGHELWSSFPLRTRRGIRRLGLRVYRVADVDELTVAGSAIASGRADEVEIVAWQEFPADSETVDADLPFSVQRLGQSTGGPADVARFWGEYAQPQIEDSNTIAELDPNLATGSMPACTAGFNVQPVAGGRLPQIDPARCTACGKCWTACPDTAIGAVALGPQSLLDAASELAPRSSADEIDPAVADKLKRAHRQLATRWASGLAATEPGTVEVNGLDDAFSWLIDAMKLTEAERPAYARAFAGTRDWIARLPFSHTDALFHRLEKEEKGSGGLSMLAVDHRSCKGCGLCASVCDDEAIRLDAAYETQRRESRAVWDAWEQLPDTPGKLISHAAAESIIGPLPAVLLSRHCLFSLVGGDGAEPGSGERIAVRQVNAVVEYQMQRRRVSQVKQLEELAAKLRERIADSLSGAFSLEDLGSLDRALDAAPGSRAPLGPVMERLEELGQRTDLDVPTTRRLVRTAQQLEQTVARITRGLSGTGRARFGVVVSGKRATAWAATFPRNPFAVPVSVDQTGAAAELALGLAQGFLSETEREARLTRRAELLLQAPSDLPLRYRELDGLTWSDLTAEERSVCPPILVVAEEPVAGLDTLLATDLPLKTVLLDPRDLRTKRVDPLLPAIAGGSAFVASTSLADSNHLFDSMTRALDFGGAALVQIHAPSPARHGFPTDATVERAALAVSCRVQPLVCFEPPPQGGLCNGLIVDGNPAIEEAWAHDDSGEELTPAVWAAGELRFAGEPGIADAMAERSRVWATLQELAGVAAPVAQKVEERLRAELEATHAAELEALRAEHQEKLLAEEDRQTRTQAAKLKDRLMQLAGYRAGAKKTEKTEDDS